MRIGTKCRLGLSYAPMILLISYLLTPLPLVYVYSQFSPRYLSNLANRSLDSNANNAVRRCLIVCITLAWLTSNITAYGEGISHKYFSWHLVVTIFSRVRSRSVYFGRSNLYMKRQRATVYEMTVKAWAYIPPFLYVDNLLLVEVFWFLSFYVLLLVPFLFHQLFSLVHLLSLNEDFTIDYRWRSGVSHSQRSLIIVICRFFSR